MFAQLTVTSNFSFSHHVTSTRNMRERTSRKMVSYNVFNRYRWLFSHIGRRTNKQSWENFLHRLRLLLSADDAAQRNCTPHSFIVEKFMKRKSLSANNNGRLRCLVFIALTTVSDAQILHGEMILVQWMKIKIHLVTRIEYRCFVETEIFFTMEEWRFVRISLCTLSFLYSHTNAARFRVTVTQHISFALRQVGQIVQGAQVKEWGMPWWWLPAWLADMTRLLVECDSWRCRLSLGGLVSLAPMSSPIPIEIY